jgi:hypothetical protein
MLGLLSSVRIAHTAQIYVVVGNAFSSRESVGAIKVVILNKEPDGFLRAEPHLYVNYAAVY